LLIPYRLSSSFDKLGKIMNKLNVLVATLAVAASSAATAGMITIDTFDGPSAYNRTLVSAAPNVGGDLFQITPFANTGNPGNRVLSLFNGSSAFNGSVSYSGITVPAGAAAWQVVYELVYANSNTTPGTTANPAGGTAATVVTVAPPSGSTISSNAFFPVSPGLSVFSAVGTGAFTGFTITLNQLNNQGVGADVQIDNVRLLYSCAAPTTGGPSSGVIGGQSVAGSAITTDLNNAGCGTVPAPASLALLGLGFAGLAAFRRKAK
jgi:PEP-CTERM motif